MTPTEARVAAIVGEFVGLDFVGPEDEVFALGADSVDVVRIGLQIEREFGLELPLDLLETTGVVREIAAWIDVRLNVA